MAQTPEGAVKTWLKKELMKQFPKMYVYMAPGGPFGKKGTPDMLCCMEGLFVAIEVKAKPESELTEMQKYQMKKLRSAGAITAAVKGKDIKRLEQICDAVRARAAND